MYISNFDDLSDFCKRAQSSKVLAVDTEFLREHTYYPQLCLVQVATPDEIAAVDPILIKDLSPLARLFQDTSITKVIHACSQDMEVLLHAMGCVPAPVFDTQLVASFLGYRMQLGYGALVESFTKVHLPKAESLTDWSRRPLDPEQLRYAEDDVRYL
ncbi:MAG: ribonuclease D, partial [Coriobacteriales bacterium]|nr:ribonuclease D [Coriobacteriales bacterium]